MPNWSGSADLTTNNLPSTGGRGTQNYRPSPTSGSYLAGTVLQLVPIDKQMFPDFQTVQPMPAGTTQTKVAGVVAGFWPGFNGSINASYTSVNNSANLVRGTAGVQAVVKGVAGILLDQSGASAVTVTDGLPLVSSRNSAGYAQGVAVATAVGPALIAVAALPSTGMGSSLTAASLAQATQTFTVTTPASGDVLNVVIQAPYTDAAPGVAQTYTYSLALNSTSGATVTTAAAALAAYLNAQGSFSQYYTATASVGVVTATVNALANLFLLTHGSGAYEQGRFHIGVSGMVANSITTTASVTGSGGTGLAAGGSTFSGGTGYKGIIPAYIYGEF